MRHPAPLLFAVLVSMPALAATIYQWTDAQGQVHYSQTPPPQVNATRQTTDRLQPGVSLTAPAKPATIAPSAKPQEPPAAVRETTQAKSQRCAAVRKRLDFLAATTPNRIMVANPDGSESRMTEEQYAENLRLAKEAGKDC